jgi:hypothetical protein
MQLYLLHLANNVMLLRSGRLKIEYLCFVNLFTYYLCRHATGFNKSGKPIK